jgi:hypothetical protein
MSSSKNINARSSAKVDPKKRLNIVLPETSWDRLERLKEDLEAETITEVVKDSFRLLEYIVSLSKSGATFQVRQPDGEVRSLELFRITTPKAD